MSNGILRRRRHKLQLLMYSTILTRGFKVLTLANLSNSDLLTRCESLQRNIAVITTPTDVDLPPDIQTTLSAYANTSWNKLDDATKVGLLWVHGYVFSGGSSNGNQAGDTIMSVYTRCLNTSATGMEMASLGVSYDDFTAQCEAMHCDSLYQDTNAKCMANVTRAFQCVIDTPYSTLPLSNDVSFWSSAASDTTLPYPQVYHHNVTFRDKMEVLQVHSIHMGNENAGVSCGPRLDAVIPCLRLEDVKTSGMASAFCKPNVNQIKVTQFLASKRGSLLHLPGSGTEILDRGNTMALLLGAMVTGGFILIMVVAACWWSRNRKKRYSEQLLELGTRRVRPTTSTTQSLCLMSWMIGRHDANGPMHREQRLSWYTFGNTGTREAAEGERRASTTGTWVGGAAKEKTVSDYCNESEGLTAFLQHPRVVASCIAFDELTFLRLLSRGAFGEVWLGQVTTQRVAIKRLLPEKCQRTSSLEQFAREIQLMCTLQHRNIVAFVGLSWNRLPNLCAVLEYMEAGELAEVLTQNRDLLSWQREKIAIAMDIAEGLVYLHCLRPVVVHRDLKSKNVLLHRNFHAKLSDFGVSRKTLINETMTSGVGTLLWTAPEIIEGKKYSEKADVYSLGVVLSEVDTCKAPFSDVLSDKGGRLPAMQLAHFVRLGIIRVSLRDDCPSNLRQMILDCTQVNPDARPSSMQVAFTLKSIIAPLLRISSSTRPTAATASSDPCSEALSSPF